MDVATVVEPSTGWKAELELGLRARKDKTVLAHRKQRGPLAVQRPFYPEGDACHLYLLHPPGGVVGGDQLRIETHVAENATAVVTTPGATKFYRSAGDVATQKQMLSVAEHGSLEWLPQENIFFPGTRSELVTSIDLAPGARFIGWEIQCLGRPANNEKFSTGSAMFALDLTRDRQPFLHERLMLGQESDLAMRSGLRNCPVNAMLIATGITKEMQESLHGKHGKLADAYIGHTLLDDVLITRYLGHSTEQVRTCFTEIWKQIRPLSIQRAPCPPRIWST